ncbi:mitochondrial ribosomal protein S28 [Lycorma delicatula]|uniref:mitochondrial ribosomal protein S28 n=1 Tax=Lycorma delicatula TaxID=130591 RepID=UPI003F516BE1
MALNKRVCYIVKNFSRVGCQYLFKSHYTTGETESDIKKKRTSGFAQAFEKYTKALDEKENTKDEPFATLFKKSKFIDLGDPEGKVVSGIIFHVVDDDLYIDFGWKFYCVCPRPQKNGSDYVRGSKVRLSIKDLELSTKFLGSDKDLTLLEADAIIIGLISSPARSAALQPSSLT